jgi:predicted ATPase
VGRIKRAASDPRFYTANELDALHHLDLETGENVDTFSRIIDMKKKSCAQFVKENIGEKTQTYSNGETGFMSLVENIVPDRLYILDEPENSLSCKLQQELAQFIDMSAKYSGCQFIIATHSPFLLALPTAKIYNLDGEPATVSKFWELPNMQLYYKLFHQFESEFHK